MIAVPLLNSKWLRTERASIAQSLVTISPVIMFRRSLRFGLVNGTSGRLRIDYSQSGPVGISVSRGATSAVDVSGIRIILVRDPSMSTGYRIHTGFPQ